MSVSVLATKLFIPPARENAIARTLLIDKLISGADRPGSFILVSGPAGFGKTTLLSELINQLVLPAAWVSLDNEDNDPIRFWTYLVTACQSVLPDVGESALELFRNPEPLSDDAIPSILINDLSNREEGIVLVLDDYHEIRNSSINSGLLFLLDHLPSNLHLVISTRTDPPWPLARFRARNQLVEIRVQDLRFSVDEAADFLNCTMGLNLTVADIAALEERTEGWAAGLQLAALSIQGHTDITGFVKAFSGSHLYVAEYLVEEVLSRQPDEVRRFLLQTSILKQMNSGLSEALTDCLDGQAMLQLLYHANLFIVPLDNEGKWFRYHHLFADLLQARLQQALSKDEIAALHLHAAAWYERNGYVVEAIQHTFSAGDYDKAALLIDQAGQAMLFTDQHNQLSNWMDTLPNKFIQPHPRLQIYRLLIDLSKGTLDMYEQTLLEKEKLIKALPPSSQNDILKRVALVHLSLFFAFQNTSRAIQIAQDALDQVPEDDLKMRAYLYSAFYRAYGMEGDVEKAAQAYRKSFRFAEAAGEYGMISNTTMIRAFDLCQYGRLDEAARYCHLVIDAGSRIKQKVFYAAGPSYIGLAGIYLERNNLEKAEEYLIRGLELCHQGATHGLFTGYVQKSRLLQAKGEPEESLKVFLNLEQVFKRREFTLMTRQVSILLAIGDIAGASNLIPALQEILGESAYAQKLPLIAAESFKLSLSRIYIAQGKIDKANQLLDEIQTTVGPGKRYGRLMEVHLLRSLALQKHDFGKISADAIANLERALDLAEAPGFVTLLLEESPALVPLLSAVIDHQTAPLRIKKYARKLLNAFEEIGKSAALRAPVESVDLIEQLTPREAEVLVLLAVGDSNQAIAEKLFITVRTVKKHTGNIYGKLDVNSRTQAVARARQLGLLPAD